MLFGVVQSLFGFAYFLIRVGDLGKLTVCFVDLHLKLGEKAAPVVTPLALPCTQLLVSFGVRGLLLAGGDDRGDALFKLRRTRDGNRALLDKSAAAEYIL